MTRRSLMDSTTASGSGLIDTAPGMRGFIFGSNRISPIQNGSSLTPAFARGETRVLLSEIAVPELQVRRYFNPAKMEQLIVSVKKHGIVSPLLLRLAPADRYPPQFKYELVAGERRYRAGIAANVIEAPCVIREMDDADALELSAIENLQREDLNPFEETEATLQVLSVRLGLSSEEVVGLLYQMANERKGNANHNVVVSDQGRRVETTFQELGRLAWDSFVSHRLPLLKLPDEVKAALQDGKIEYTKANAIASVKDDALRGELLETAIGGEWSLSQIKEQVKEMKPAKRKEERSTVKGRFDQAYKRLKQAKAWDDPQKAKKLEKLIVQIEDLLTNDRENGIQAPLL